MKDNKQEMLRRARELMGSGQVFQPMGMEAAKAKLEQHLNGGISNARDRLRESAQCEQTVLALNDLLNETQKKAMLLVADNDRLRAEIAELRKQPAVVPEEVMRAVDRMCKPLDDSWLGSQSATAQSDARCMKVIRDYILSTTDTEVKNG